jgi:predicted nuclease of predicted toxin-antitoxin system
LKFLGDENLFDPIIDYLKSTGHDVFSVRDNGLSGISDEEIYKMACEKKYIIITMDKDFSRFVRFPAKYCGGIILVKIYRRTVDETLKIFRKFFELIEKDDMKENLIIITPEGYRIKRS